MSTIVSLSITVLILGILIFAHELGHFLVAKWVGIRVHEFALGMGPVVFSRQSGDTLYSLRAFPIGGFNRMAGMEPGEEDDPKGFNTKTVSQRMVVIAAGSLMNFALAIIFFMVLFMGIGIPADSNKIAGVLDGSPAQLAGLQEGDRIIAVDGTKTPNWDKLTSAIRAQPNKELQITVSRSQKEFQAILHTEINEQENVGMIGIKRSFEKKGFFESIWLGITSSVALIVFIVQQLFLMIRGLVPADVAGPVGMVQLVGQAVDFGFGTVIQFAAMLSLNLGIINLLPIPALDGSRLVFLAVEGVRGRALNPDRENMIHFVGFMLLIGLMLLITYQDIWRILFK